VRQRFDIVEVRAKSASKTAGRDRERGWVRPVSVTEIAPPEAIGSSRPRGLAPNCSPSAPLQAASPSSCPRQGTRATKAAEGKSICRVKQGVGHRYGGAATRDNHRPSQVRKSGWQQRQASPSADVEQPYSGCPGGAAGQPQRTARSWKGGQNRPLGRPAGRRSLCDQEFGIRPLDTILVVFRGGLAQRRLRSGSPTTARHTLGGEE